MIIELGSRGVYARAMQRAIGVPYTLVDGVCGPNTVAVLKAWQARHGVEPDGVFGDESRAAVQAADFIKAYEGFVPQAYDDAGDAPLSSRLLTWNGSAWVRVDGSFCRRNPTIGWGTRIWPGQERDRGRCTKAQADGWLEQYVHEQLDDVVKRLAPDADACQRAALFSLGYNGGRGAVINASNARFAHTWWITNYTNKGELLKRREEEAAFYWGEDLPAAA